MHKEVIAGRLAKSISKINICGDSNIVKGSQVATWFCHVKVVLLGAQNWFLLFGDRKFSNSKG